MPNGNTQKNSSEFYSPMALNYLTRLSLPVKR